MAELKSTEGDGAKAKPAPAEAEPKEPAAAQVSAQKNESTGNDRRPLEKRTTPELVEIARRLQQEARGVGGRDPNALGVLRRKLAEIMGLLERRKKPAEGDREGEAEPSPEQDLPPPEQRGTAALPRDQGPPPIRAGLRELPDAERAAEAAERVARIDRAPERREGIMSLLREGVSAELVASYFRIPPDLMASLSARVAAEPAGRRRGHPLHPRFAEAVERILTAHPSDSLRQISDDLGISLGSVRKYAERVRMLSGDPPHRAKTLQPDLRSEDERPRGGGGQPHPLRAEAKRLLSEGVPPVEVERRLPGVSRASVFRWDNARREQAGLPRRPMGGQRHLLRAEAERLLGEGVPPVEVERRLPRVSRASIWKWDRERREKAGLPLRTTGGKPHLLRAIGVRRLDEGRTVKEVSLELNVRRDTVRRWDRWRIQPQRQEPEE